MTSRSAPTEAHASMTMEERIIDLLTSGDLHFFGRPAHVARHLKVSRQRVQQVIEQNGGREKLGLPDWRDMAEKMLRQGTKLKDIRAATGHSIAYLKWLARELDIRRCADCGGPREYRRRYCESCREGRRIARDRYYQGQRRRKEPVA